LTSKHARFAFPELLFRHGEICQGVFRSGAKLREFESRWLKLPEVQVVGLQQVKNTLVNLVSTAQTMIAAVAAIRSSFAKAK